MKGKLSHRVASPCFTAMLLCATTLSALTASQASAEDAANDVAAIELRRLLEPTPGELKQEQKGRIYIYDGVRDVDIDTAMDVAFDRIDSMMFIRVRKTDETGKAMRDPTTGEFQVQDDGC